MAIVAMTAGTLQSLNKQNQMVSAANAAQREGNKEMVANQNRLSKEAFDKRKERFTVLGGGAPSGQEASKNGTILTQSSNKQSLLG